MWALGCTGAGTSLLLVQPCQKWTPESESKHQAKSKEAEPVPLALSFSRPLIAFSRLGCSCGTNGTLLKPCVGSKDFVLSFSKEEKIGHLCAEAEEWALCCIHKAEDTAEALSRNMSLMEKESLVTHPVLSAMSAVTGGGL